MIRLDGAAILVPREFPTEPNTEIFLASQTGRTHMGWTLFDEPWANQHVLRVDPLGIWLRFTDEWRVVAAPALASSTGRSRSPGWLVHR